MLCVLNELVNFDASSLNTKRTVSNFTIKATSVNHYMPVLLRRMAMYWLTEVALCFNASLVLSKWFDKQRVKFTRSSGDRVNGVETQSFSCFQVSENSLKYRVLHK